MKKSWDDVGNEVIERGKPDLATEQAEFFGEEFTELDDGMELYLTDPLRDPVLTLSKLADSVNSKAVTEIGEAAALVGGAAAMLVKAQDVQRQLLDPPLPDIWSFDGDRRLLPAIMSPIAPWLAVGAPALEGPGMITDEEKLYYAYIGNFYQGNWAGGRARPLVGRFDPTFCCRAQPKPQVLGVPSVRV